MIDYGLKDKVVIITGTNKNSNSKDYEIQNIMPRFAEQSPHLVLLDIGLPVMDGYHWCREMNIGGVKLHWR